MENKTLKKILVIAIVFMITFSNCGFTLQALATSEGISVLGFNLFGSNKLEFNAYFLDSNGKEQESNVADVNSEMTLVVELEPKEEGYLKSGTIKAVTEEREPNFEIVEVLTEEQEKEENVLTQIFAPDETLLKTEQVLDMVEAPDVHITKEEDVADTTNIDIVSNTVEDAAQNVVENTVDENTVSDDAANENVIEQPEEEELIDEDAVANEKIEEEQEEVEVIKNAAEASVVSENEIEVKNVIEPTKLYVKLKFKQGEKLDISDVYKKINFEFTGKYINVDLEEIDIAADTSLEIGWSYSKDIEVSSEYTKVSPFEVGETKGTLIENKIVVKREIEDEKYLPLKQTKIEIEVPELDGKKPIAMEVSANKLMATKGEDINEVVFTDENWEYSEMSNTLIITVENTDANYTYGEDIYVVTYRYENYVESNEIGLKTAGKVSVEEFSGKDNNVIEKDFSGEQKIVVNVGELITYSIGTTEEKINKGKINANYNSAETVYETEFSTTVNINVLTNDVLNEFTLKDTKEFYIDKQNLEFETQDVKYKKIKLKYDEIRELLEKGGTIEIKSNSGELLYTLNSELIKSQENCEIEIRGDITGLDISFKNIAVNGTITVDFIKAIGKSSFDKSAFNNFEKLESRIKAEVKYLSDEATTELKPIKTEKYFENSFTKAEVSLDRDSLSTIEKNENVEIKIKLNNHLETSDLYVNPVFEIAFPRYVKNVEPKATNLLYEDELKVARTVVFTEDGIVKMQVALEGKQTKFSTGNLSNGTNLIINTNIEVDNYTPRKDDQLRMYYYNEGVTNYESQTKWTVKTDIPTGIIKTTNGFDVEVFSYKAPSGFIAVNEIENYDGTNSSVASIKQGEETREIARERGSQAATMRLVAMNNTGNDCTDVTLLGRIPTKDTTDVKTGESLGNNIDTVIISGIVPDDNNPISSTIYYSANPKATKDLKDESNGWTETPENLTQMKSFLIIPTGIVAKETVFQYTYQFQIPADLPYEAAMYGSFGAFYNNHSDVAVMYESEVADKVGLVTKAGPKIEAVMTVDIGDGAEVLEGRLLKYTITVVNSGSIPAEEVVIKNNIPQNTTYQVKGESLNGGDHGYINDPTRELVFEIGTLEVGQVFENSYYVRVDTLPDLLEYASSLGQAAEDEKGVYYYNEQSEKIYVSEIPEMYVENYATIQSLTIANEIKTNITKNKIQNANFETNLSIQYDRYLEIGYDNEFTLFVSNISGKTLTNVEAIFHSTEGMKFVSGACGGNSEVVRYDMENDTVHFNVGEMKADTFMLITAKFVTENIKEVSKDFDCYFELKADGIKTEHTTKIPQKIVKSNLQAEISDNLASEKLQENQEIGVSIKVTNTGLISNTNSTIDTIITDGIKLKAMKHTGAQNAEMSTHTEEGKVTNVIPVLKPNESITIDMVLITKNREGSGVTKESIQNIIHNEYQEDVVLDVIDFELENNLLTKEEENDKLLEEYEEELKQKQEEEKKEENNSSENENTDNNNNSEEPSIDNSGDNNDNANVDNNFNNDVPNDTNNNIDNDTENNSNNSNEENNTSNENNQVEEKPTPIKHQINGLAWKDDNCNGVREDNEQKLSGVKVYLYNSTNNAMIKSMTTDSKGEYAFKDLENGKYIVGFEYDNEKYKVTAYRAQDIEENRNSDAIENSSISEKIKAVTDYITVLDNDVNNLDIGLQIRDNFDLTIAKHITSAKVMYKDKEDVHKYDNLELAKLEIDAKKLAKSTVTLEYSIVIKNEGNVEGNPSLVVDYLPADTKLDENNSKDWYLGTDGNAYNESLKNTILKPGESRELKIVLIKDMTEENTGVVSNKVELKATESKGQVKEISSNNSNTQEIIIAIRTGYVAHITVVTIIVTGIVIISYFIINKKITIDFKNFRINKIYK